MSAKRLKTPQAICAIAIAAISLHPQAATQAPVVPVAGLTPYQRPADAPQITAVPAHDTPGSPSLHGITPPVPPSLKFLRDQGNWYSPFDRPGMPGPYDLRGWYSNPPAARKH